ncbi:MAG: hypothetical protein EXS15_08075 [Phycisphaerales bacterium]|nr:hypothetical protein [Phycisphaerales bacterium]
MRALPAPGTDGAQAMADVHPWLRRARVGRVRSFRRTTIEALLRPTNLGAALAPQVALRDALTYSMFCGSLGVLGGVGAPFAFIMFLNTGWRNMTSLLQSTAILFGVTLAAVVLFQCGLLLWGCAAHLLLRATGPVVRPWKTTASAILYCSAPLVFSALPCCCVYIFCVSLVWMMISALFAVVGAQRVSAGRAAFAVLCPSVLLLGSIIAVFFWAFVTVALGGINLPSPANPSQQSSQQSSLFAPADPSQGPAPTLSDPQSLPAP